MKFFKVNKLFKKIIITFLVINIVCNIIIPNYALGKWDIVGAVLVKPLASVVILVGDAVNLVLDVFLGGANSEKYTGRFGQSGGFSWGDLEDAAYASPEKIFTGQYTILNANLFNATTIENSSNYTFDPSAIGGEVTGGLGANAISNLKSAVAGIYYLLRNVGALFLLCLLIYTGIRIVLSARSPEEQSKWRGYLYDWLKALILLIFMHIIMITIFKITDMLASALKDAIGDGQSITNMIRGAFQESWGSVELLTTTIMYLYATYLTVVFAFAYFRRTLWTAILILMAPIVAVLYATGNEGKSIYQRWFREFLINCMIQPYHIVVYYILVMLPINIAGN